MDSLQIAVGQFVVVEFALVVRKKCQVDTEAWHEELVIDQVVAADDEQVVGQLLERSLAQCCQ